MAGNRNQVQHAAAQIVLRDFLGPILEFEKSLNGVHLRRDNRRIRKSFHLRVAGNVVAVRVGVRND
jgi:hypothetical protein